MTERRRRLMPNLKASVIILAAALAGTAGMSASRANEADAKRLFKAMSDYLGAQSRFEGTSDAEPE